MRGVVTDASRHNRIERNGHRKEQRVRVIIAGGGTGGHLFPGLAIAEELLSRGGENSVLFLGAQGGMEETLLPKLGHRLELLPSLKGGLFGLDFPRKTLRLCKGYLQARKAILDFKAQAVVGLGGYASALPVLASWGVEVPCMVLEQNVIPGRTTRKLAGFAAEVGVQFKEAEVCLPNAKKVRALGNPLRRKLIDASYPAATRNCSPRSAPDEPVLLVLGGSQGARFLNQRVVEAWPKLKQALPKLRVILVAGKDDYDRAAAAFASAGLRGEVHPFHERMEELYAQADLVFARAGATSLAEISAFALPSILVPYPHAADDHQRANGRVYRLAGAAWCLEQERFETDRFAQRIADICLQPERRRRMAQNAAALARPEAAAEVVDRLERLAGLRDFKTPPPAPPLLPPHRPDAVHAGVA